MAKITISGGFHNVAPISVLVNNDRFTPGQYRRLHRHLCGIKGCVCGGRGADIDGMPAGRFWDMMRDAAADEYMARHQ